MSRSEGKYRRAVRELRTNADGVVFDSRGEMGRWGVLCLLLRAGEITNLQRQVKYPIVVNGVLVTSYTADFVYEQDGMVVVEDFKSSPTRSRRDYRIKKKLMLAVHGIQILETSRKDIPR